MCRILLPLLILIEIIKSPLALGAESDVAGKRPFDAVVANVAYRGPPSLLWSVSISKNELEDIVRDSLMATLYLFPDPLPLSRKIRDARLLVYRSFRGSDLTNVRLTLAHITPFSSVDPIQPCRFTPTIGIEFVDLTGSSSAWWLLSEPCQDAVLVSSDDDWTRVKPSRITGHLIAELLSRN